MELQKRFDGTVEATFDPSIRKLAAIVPDDLKSEDKVRLMWCSHPIVQAFIHNALPVTKFEEMRTLYNEHIADMKAMETFARSVRDGLECSGEPDSGAVSTLITTPGWYLAYLRTDYWRHRIIPMAKRYFVSCVLCGGCLNLQVHHRNYHCIGCETTSDISLLCDDHHKKVHAFLSLYVPRKAPQAAEKIFAKESRQP